MFVIQKTSQATAIGLVAILLWSTTIALIRRITEQMGIIGGTASLYTISAITLLLIVGVKSLKGTPRKYLWAGSIIFIFYELCFAFSIGLAASHSQVLEVSMVNYLWPSLTTLLAIVMNKEHAKWWIVIGLALALVGVITVISGENHFVYQLILSHIQDNPFSYLLSAAGAFLWALYCNVTRRYAQGHNGVVLFTSVNAVVLWVIHFSCSPAPIPISWTSGTEVMVAGVAMGLAYGCWNVGILKGNLVLLATASYFTPILSVLFATYILDIHLSMTFLQGAVLVTLGSMICWYATRNSKPKTMVKTVVA